MLKKIDKLRVAGYTAPVVRSRPQRKINTYNRDTGEKTGEITDSELQESLLKRVGIEFGTNDKKETKYLTCVRCRTVKPTTDYIRGNSRIYDVCEQCMGGQSACAGEGCDEKPSRYAFSSPEVKKRGGRPWLCKTCYGKSQRTEVIQDTCLGFHDTPCPTSTHPPSRRSLVRTVSAGWRCRSCTQLQNRPKELVSQTECAGWMGKCPDGAVPPKRAFITRYVKRRNGRPWKCHRCAVKSKSRAIL